MLASLALCLGQGCPEVKVAGTAFPGNADDGRCNRWVACVAAILPSRLSLKAEKPEGPQVGC